VLVCVFLLIPAVGTTYAQPSFKNDFGITNMTASQQSSTSSNITSSYLGAAFFGAFFAWPVMEKFGRRPAIQIGSFIFFIGAIIMVAATHQLSMQYAGRIITGFVRS
jgi:MFS family permease